MTAVLSAMDPLRKDRHLSLDDDLVNYSGSNIDWREKYNEVVDMLAETRTELEEFQHASKELEAELENELQRTEKAHQELKVKAARAESERDDWKTKFMSLQTTHNTTTASLQKELDKLRQDYQQIKVQLRELEMGNDDLERSERAVTSSLVDMEAKYTKALEEKILLEHELLEKANLEEETQRLRDELRDANVEILILKDQLSAVASQPSPNKPELAPNSSFLPNLKIPSEDDLLKTPLPPDLQLSEFEPTEALSSIDATPKAKASINSPTSESTPTQRIGSQHVGSQHVKSLAMPTLLPRSTTLPSLSQPPIPRTPTRSSTARHVSIASTSSTSTAATTSKHKGVQMVSEMRARVKNLEQKIHTKVPRLRLGSVVARQHSNVMSNSVTTPATITSGTTSSRSTLVKSTWEGFARRSNDSKRSNDNEPNKNKSPTADSTGWVLIMEDSPSPKEKRASSPTAPTSYRMGPPVPNQSTTNTGIRRPSSRLSGASLSTVTTTSSIPTPTSRPATPTFLPVPSNNIYAHSSTAGLSGIKRPTGISTSGGVKRTSFGSDNQSPNLLPTRPSTNTPLSSSRYGYDNARLPPIPALQTSPGKTLRAPTRFASTSSTLLSSTQSRIARPHSAGLSGRKGAPEGERPKEIRPRASSSVANYPKDS
ncbi:hypothetical protein AX16_009627 [Volvariella volvacea WC 439]|nr:hypothetical protein AX16_009627 [Volvariella volvacea WC 439]